MIARHSCMSLLHLELMPTVDLQAAYAAAKESARAGLATPAATRASASATGSGASYETGARKPYNAGFRSSGFQRSYNYASYGGNYSYASTGFGGYDDARHAHFSSSQHNSAPPPWPRQSTQARADEYTYWQSWASAEQFEDYNSGTSRSGGGAGTSRSASAKNGNRR